MSPPSDPAQRFFAHASSEGPGRGHLVAGASTFEDAAMRFVEDRLDAEEDGQVKVIVRDAETGEQHCFCVDVGEETAQPC
jgi:hypothetical protein